MKSGGERVHSCKNIKDGDLKAQCQSTFEACKELPGEDYQASCTHLAEACIDMYVNGASSFPLPTPIGTSLTYSTPISCFSAAVRLTNNFGPLKEFQKNTPESEIEPGTITRQDTAEPNVGASPDVPASLPPVEYPPLDTSESPPMEGRAEFFKTLLGIVIREIDASPNYVRRIDAILERMSMRGINIKELGPVHHASALIGGGALAMVISISNDFHVGSAGGYSDWLLELVLAHEYRHQIQNESLWEKIVAGAGLDPNRFSLHEAYSGEGVPPEFKAVYEIYLDAVTGPPSRLGPFMELDAYLYMYNYYKTHLAGETAPEQYFILNVFIRKHIEYYLDKINTDYGQGNLSESEREVYDRAVALRSELYGDMSKVQEMPPDFDENLLAYLDGVFEKYSGTLEFPDGENYSLRERLLVLQGATSELALIRRLSSDVAGATRSANFAALSANADEKSRDLDSLLNRQTLRYSRQLRDNTPHAVEYRNDLRHTPDGLARDQWFAEADFGGKGEIKEDIRLGADTAIYYHLSENIFLRSGFSLYGGYQTGIKNPMLGLRFDALQVHWDIPFTQSVGVSLFAGYSLGMHAGWEDSDVYDSARVGAEIFNF